MTTKTTKTTKAHTTRSFRLYLAALTVAAAATAARPALARPAVMVETDPSTFVLGGFAAHLRLQLEGSHFALGAGAYALNFPGLLVDLDGANRGAGWNVRLRLGAGLFADYYLAPQPRAWFVGAQVALQDFRYQNDASPGESASAVNALVMPRVGYLWRPFPSAGFYVMPWAGVGVTAQIAGGRRVGAKEYDLFPVIPFATLHVGWQL
jgi:hypothetical protein